MLNSLELFKETVNSVLLQKAYLDGQVALEYIICDGGSDDGSIEWLESLENASIKIISEKDTGVYDALSKGCLWLPDAMDMDSAGINFLA